MNKDKILKYGCHLQVNHREYITVEKGDKDFYYEKTSRV